MTVVRRCVDLADLLAAAAAGTARAVLVSADLRRLDRDALARLGVAGVAVVGLVTGADEAAERRLRHWGVEAVVSGDGSPAQIAAAVTTAVSELGRRDDGAGHRTALAEPRAALPDQPPPAGPDTLVPPGSGRLVAVWGPTGAPGRSSIAVTLAAELAAAGAATLLADADVYGGVVAQLLGLLDESPGLAAAARLANNASLDLPALAALAPVVAPGLRLLTGISRADRWPELRPASVEAVLARCRSLAAMTVVDCGFCLEQDEELSYDTMAPRRNGATLATLAAADTVIAVCAADPVGIQRFVRSLPDLRELTGGAEVLVVVNRVRRSAVGRDADRQVTEALDRYAGVRVAALVPSDPAAFDAAVLAGRSVTDVAPSSPARAAIAALADRVTGGDRAAGTRPSRRRRRAA